MDKDQARRVCQLIAGIVIADDDLDPAEEAFIDRLIARFGLSEEDRDALFPIVDADEAAGAMKTLPAAVCTETLELLIQAAVADGKVVDVERDYLGAVAKALDVADEDLEKRIAAKLGGS